MELETKNQKRKKEDESEKQSKRGKEMILEEITKKSSCFRFAIDLEKLKSILDFCDLKNSFQFLKKEKNTELRQFDVEDFTFLTQTSNPLVVRAVIYQLEPQENSFFIEEIIYSQVIPYLENHTPHLVEYIGSKECRYQPSTNKNSLAQNIPSMMYDFGSKLKIDSELLQKMIHKIDLQKASTLRLFFTKSYTDRKNGFQNLKVFLEELKEMKFENTIDEIEQVIDAIIFQVTWTILCWSYLGMNHNDLNFSNIYVKRLQPNEVQKIEYRSEKFRIIREDKIFVKIGGFRFATWPTVIVNKSFNIEDSLSVFDKAKNEKSSPVDLYSFLSRLMEILENFPSVANETIKDSKWMLFIRDFLNLSNFSLDEEFLNYVDLYKKKFHKNLTSLLSNQYLSNQYRLFKINPYSSISPFHSFKSYHQLLPFAYQVTTRWNVVSYIRLFLVSYFELTQNNKTKIDFLSSQKSEEEQQFPPSSPGFFASSIPSSPSYSPSFSFSSNEEKNQSILQNENDPSSQTECSFQTPQDFDSLKDLCKKIFDESNLILNPSTNKETGFFQK